MIEVAVSILVLMAALNITVKVLGWVGNERRAADRRQWAVQAASNVLERVSSVPFDRVTPETVKAIASRTAAERSLPGATWEVAVDDDRDAPVPAKRVSVLLRWKERAGALGTPVRLTCWVFSRGDSR